MAGFYYFLPGATLANAVDGRRLNPSHPGLATIGEALKVPQQATVSEVAHGPTGTSGLIVQPHAFEADDNQVTGYHPDRQRWLEGDENVWIGWLTDAPPRAEDLARAEMIPGGFLPTEAGQWVIPLARSPNYAMLPMQYRYGPSGALVAEEVMRQWVWLWELSGEVWDFCNYRNWKARLAADDSAAALRPADLPAVDEDALPIGATRDVRWLQETALRILGVNYRFGWLEQNAFCEMGTPVLTGDAVNEVAFLLIDLQFIREIEAEKKTSDPPALDTTSGEPPEATPAELPAVGN